MSAGTVSVHLSDDLRDLIDGRAEPISLSRSRFIALIVKFWKEHGAPPVSEPDRLMLLAKSSEKKK